MIQNFSSDKPVENEIQDRFQRYSFSKRIAETILTRNNQDGIVIGIYGAWGEGKTSVQNFIENELKKDDSVLIIKLNPWRYNDEETLIRNFLKKIAEVLGKELENKKEKLGSFIGKYGGVTGIFGVDISDFGKSLAEVDLEELKNRIDEFLKESTCKLVIFVDDIDRLDKHEIYSLFRLVKLTGDFTNTTYILSFDEVMVAAAIGERFGSGNEQSGQNFLEKIIQVPLKIPQAQIDALKKYCFELVDKAINENTLNLSEEEVQRYVSAFSYNILLRLKTPRLAVRYGNSLSFAIPLLKGEVNHVDLMLIEAIKIFYPRHYLFIKNNPNYFISSYSSNSRHNNSQTIKTKKDELIEQLDLLSSDLSKVEKEAIQSLLISLFPRLNEAFHNTFQYEGEKEWLKQKRIVSTSYFKRYFSYSVIEGELSDVAFDNFMSILDTYELKDIVNEIKGIIAKSTANTFIFKARSYEEELTWKASYNLILSIAITGNDFPKSNSIFSFGMDGAQAQAAILIYNLLKNHSNKEESFELSKILMGKQIPFEFSYQINKWLRSGETMAEKIFTEKQYIGLSKALRYRALKDSEGIPLFEKYPENSSYLLATWHEENPKKLQQYLIQIFEKEPSKIKDLLIASTPTAQSTSQPEPYKSNFTNHNFEHVISLLDKNIIHAKIREAFGKEVDEENVVFDDFGRKQSDINIMRQFEYWYSKGFDEAEIVE
jgi:predicted KAP-like P-loop ATPase